MWHMFFCSVLAFCLVRSGYVAPVEGMTMEVYMRAIVPIGLLFSVVLWTGNTAYMYLSVSFIQMLKVRHARGVVGGCTAGRAGRGGGLARCRFGVIAT